MTPPVLALGGLLSAPLLVAAAAPVVPGVRDLRRLAAGAALVGAISGALFVLLPGALSLAVAWPASIASFMGGTPLRVDALSIVLVPLPAALWLLTVGVTPRSRLGRRGLGRTALATVTTTLAFLTDSPVLLLVLWGASSALFLSALAEARLRRVRRVTGAYLAASTLLLGLGLALAGGAAETAPPLEPVGLALIVTAILIRKGIFPFHAWIPEAFDRGRLGPVVLFSAPQMGSYLAAVLVAPRASPELLRVMAILSLVTAVYGAALAVFQRDARRACGYLFVSQSALVLAGLDCASPEALSGALVLWLSSALAFTGIARCVLVLEARRGRLDLTRYHGGYDRMPLLAASFLVLGLACTGFPGTLGFVGEELLVEGTIAEFPILGFFVVASSALTGFAVLRMYFSLFCGRDDHGPHVRLRLREAIVFGALAGVLVLSGLVPGGIVASRVEASRSLIERRSSPDRATHGKRDSVGGWQHPHRRGR